MKSPLNIIIICRNSFIIRPHTWFFFVIFIKIILNNNNKFFFKNNETFRIFIYTICNTSIILSIKPISVRTICAEILVWTFVAICISSICVLTLDASFHLVYWIAQIIWPNTGPICIFSITVLDASESRWIQVI